LEEARAWLDEFTCDFESVAVSSWVPDEVRPGLREEEPQAAELGVSVARLAIAETGSLLLDSREGRAVQLLPPTHLVWVWTSGLRDRLSEALEEVREELPAALALHSGPSRSADIGQITVKGVHGPGRVIAVVVPRPGSADLPDR
jgi:L-lactate dehydrogenase complex protein LldG